MLGRLLVLGDLAPDLGRLVAREEVENLGPNVGTRGELAPDFGVVMGGQALLLLVARHAVEQRARKRRADSVE